MKTPKKDRNSVRESILAIPLSKQEKTTIQNSADEMGVTMSTFARFVLKDFMKKADK